MGEFDNETFIELEGGDGPKGMPAIPGIRATIGLHVILMIMGSFGNLVTLYIYGRRGDRFTYTIGILALGVKDLLFCAFVLPFCIIVEILMYNMSSDFFCKLFHYSNNVPLPLTVYILTVLAIERCACICHSHLHATRSKLVYVAVITASCVSFIQAIVPAMGFGVYSKIRYQPLTPNISKASVNTKIVNTGICDLNADTTVMDTLFGYHLFSIYSLSTLTVAMLLVYASTCVVVVYKRNRLPNQEFRLTQVDPKTNVNEKNENADVDDSGHGGADQNVTNDGGKKVQDEQIWLGLVFFVCTVSFWLTLLPAYLMVFRAIKGSLLVICIHHIHFAINPVVYFSMDTRFRKEALELFRSRWSRLVNR